VVTARAEEVSRRHSLRAWLAEVTRNADVERIDLEPLGREETAVLIRSIITANMQSDEIDEIHRRSDGNPFFVEELLATQAGRSGSLPSGLQDILLARIDALSEPARRLIGVASVGGREIEHDRLLDVVGEPEAQVAGWLEELVAAALLIPIRDPGASDVYSFRHALLHEAVYGSLLPIERRRLHKAWAETLISHDRTASGGASRLVELAHHWREADDERAFASAVMAGDAAIETFAFETAAREFEEALRSWPPPQGVAIELDHVDLLRRLARASYFSGDDREAVSTYRQAIAETQDDVVRRTEMRVALARSLWVLGEWGAATETYEEALRGAPAEPIDTRTRAMSGLGQTYMANGQFIRSRPLCEEAVKRARETGNRELEGHALNSLGMDLAWMGRLDAGEEALDAALQIALELEHPDDVGRAYVSRGWLLILSGRFDEALSTATEGLEAAERLGAALIYGPHIEYGVTHAAFQAGRWDIAIEHLEQADRILPPSEAGPFRACQVLQFLAARGDPSAPDVWEHARQHLGQMPPSHLTVQLYIGGIEVATQDGRIDDAIAIVDEAVALVGRTDGWIHASELARVAAWPIADLGSRARMSSDDGEMLRAQQRINEMADLASASVRHLEAPAGPVDAQLELDRAQIDAERERLRGDSNAGTWSSLADRWSDIGRPYRALYALWRAAEAADAEGDRGSAVALLRECHAEAETLGAAPLASRLERLARRMRVRLDTDDPATPRRSQRSPYGLTPREDEVLALLVAGRTNQQIADELFITRSTAGVHVSNILSKLGVSGRSEASDLARREGLTQESPIDRQQDGR